MRLLIVEDEPLVAARLLRLVQAWGGVRLRLTHAATPAQAAESLHTRAIDGLLLDLNLRGEDGFGLLRRTLAGGLPTVVVSAHHDRALEAFSLGVLDFVPKPFLPERLHAALERLLTRAPLHAEPVLGVWRAQGVAVVPVADVRRIEADGDSCRLYLRSGRDELIERALEALAQQLPPHFQRCHRRHVVNLLCVRRLTGGRGSRYQLELEDGAVVPVGRTWLAAVRMRLGLVA